MTACILYTPLFAATVPLPDPSRLPQLTKPIAHVLVPIPSETFASLDQYRDSNWSAVQRPLLAQATPHGDSVGIALILGAMIGEGFVAVEAKDAGEIKHLGRAILAHARALGVERTVLRHSQSIVDKAEQEDWTGVRKEWDGVLPDVKQAMTEVKSEELSQIVSLGGWLRGTGALAAVILQNYSSAQAELLRQPALLDYLEAQLGAMKPDPKIAAMKDGIRKVRALTVAANEPLPKASVIEIAKTCDELLATLNPHTGRERD